MEEEERPMGTNAKLDKLIEAIGANGGVKPKPKPFRMPWGAKVSNMKLKQGYCSIIEVSENNALRFTKERIVDSTVKLGDTFHAVSDGDILTYKGKPALIIAKCDREAVNPNSTSNNTYAQKHIMSRMMNEVIGTGKKMGLAGISIGAIILLGVIAYAFIAG
jgi:hypothetical protein